MKNELKIGKHGIKLTEKDKVDAILAQVNGRASKFVANRLDVERAAKMAEARLEAARLPQALRVGCRVEFISGGPGAKAYEYAAAGTMFQIVRAREGWMLVDASRTSVYPRQREKLTITVSAKVAEEIKERSVEDIRVAA
ncbi:hypothetical protein NGR_c06780 [Sinorhizobium fredii NGR234]|uniref:Uncharacterized protein n=1 Tax=Sinorhizobium fredii (strain NBRC 101917 / NGR234) TaxID=394 RepID=C3MIC3_SINFN|nr:hypothetical protein [Sinorhizobium fredii]ACP24471.1 hypothetical protein NGR_c06780 [Sinorhizobium fredii NGR234]